MAYKKSEDSILTDEQWDYKHKIKDIIESPVCDTSVKGDYSFKQNIAMKTILLGIGAMVVGWLLYWLLFNQINNIDFLRMARYWDGTYGIDYFIRIMFYMSTIVIYPLACFMKISGPYISNLRILLDKINYLDNVDKEIRNSHHMSTVEREFLKTVPSIDLKKIYENHKRYETVREWMMFSVNISIIAAGFLIGKYLGVSMHKHIGDQTIPQLMGVYTGLTIGAYIIGALGSTILSIPFHLAENAIMKEFTK